MQKKIKLFLSIILISSITLKGQKNGPFFSTRSQSENAARNIAGWQQKMNVNEKGKTFSNINITPGYSRSFRHKDITKFFFGDDLVTEDSIIVSGSEQLGTSTTRNEHDTNHWFADYFGLPKDFKSTISFKPKITNLLIDFNGIISLDDILESAFIEFHAPICRCETDLQLVESDITPGTETFQNGVMIGLSGNAAVPTRETLPLNFEEAIRGTTTFGDMNSPMKYGKMDGKQKKTRLSDIHINAGYTLFHRKNCNLAIKLCAAIPTGSELTAEYLFEPVVGNGKHWEFGGGFNGHAILWTSNDENKSIGVYADAKITHMFNARQKRSFDLKNKLNSRYMLIAEHARTNDGFLFGVPGANIESDAAATISTYQYQRRLFPLINKTTLKCDSRIAIQADMALKFAFVWGGFALDLGYNVWGKTKEKITIKEQIDENKFTLKGSAKVYGFAEATDADIPAVQDQQAIALAVSHSRATIKDGIRDFEGTTADVNGNIDNKVPARSRGAAGANRRIDRSPADIQLYTSLDPIFITQSDLDDSDRPSQITHKVFGHMSYTWKNREAWVPFVGIGAEGEFDGRSKNNRTALSQWGVWGKMGISFN